MKLKHIFLLLFSIMFFSISCEKLEEDTKSILTPGSFFNTEEELDAAITSIFTPIIGSWSGFDVRGFSMVAGDDHWTSRQGSNKERVLEFDEFGVTVTNPELINIWKVLYQSITRCNVVIQNAERIEMDETVRNKKVAQAYYMRALQYFFLVRWFNGVPLITVPIEGEGADIIRSSVEDVYNQIISDATFAEQNLPLSWTERGRPTKGAALALLADAYITMAGWPLKKEQEYYAKAAQKAKEVINLNRYELASTNKELWSFAYEGGAEWIFAYECTANARTFSKLGKPMDPPEDGGWVDYFSEIPFFQNYPEQPRKDATFYTIFSDGTSWENSTIGHPFINKYQDGVPKGHTNTERNFPISRYADVLLLYAEAQNLADGAPNADAYKALNDVRARARRDPDGGADADYPDLSGLSSAEFDEAVLQERSYELCFEMKRWFDLVRREKVEEANVVNQQRLRNTITKELYTYPIPQRESDLNPNLLNDPGL